MARYVVLNPVRAQMVSEAREWPWRRYAAMVGTTQCSPWLERDWLLGQFAKRRPTAVRRYMYFVCEGVGQPPLETFLEMADPHESMVAAYCTGAYSMQAIGDAFGVHYSKVSRAVRRAEKSACGADDTVLPNARAAPGSRSENVS